MRKNDSVVENAVAGKAWIIYTLILIFIYLIFNNIFIIFMHFII